MAVVLGKHQIDAVKKLHPGSILCGGVGTGKTRTALAYYYFVNCGGKQPVNGKGDWELMKDPKPLYVITTAKKRDSGDWVSEALDFSIFEPHLINEQLEKFGQAVKDNKILNQCKIATITVDSWNNIKKYVDVTGAFFIFDEQRVVGSGTWSKTFEKIAKKNDWILLSATPGDTWMDYIPVFIANGFYKNKTEFLRRHVVFNRFAKYPKVDHYVDAGTLVKHRSDILVNMYYPRETVRHRINFTVGFDQNKYNIVFKDRWNIYEDEPIKNISELCYLARKVVNSDKSRADKLAEILESHSKAIVFYNYDYELDIIREVCENLNVVYSEWNGHNHEDIPETDRWVYIVQYTAGSEGWNCTKTDTVVFYSLNYSYKIMEQSSGRIDRMNTPYKDLYYYELTSTAPIDQGVRRALKKKKKFNEVTFVKGEYGEEVRAPWEARHTP